MDRKTVGNLRNPKFRKLQFLSQKIRNERLQYLTLTENDDIKMETMSKRQKSVGDIVSENGLQLQMTDNCREP